jgi:hypothetical protein
VTPSFPPSANEDHPLLKAVTHDPWIRDRRLEADMKSGIHASLFVEIYSPDER